MQQHVAPFLYVWAVMVVASVLVLTGVADMVLKLTGHMTISTWLGENPGWFWWPAGVTVAFLILLALHLFVE